VTSQGGKTLNKRLWSIKNTHHLSKAAEIHCLVTFSYQMAHHIDPPFHQRQKRIATCQ